MNKMALEKIINNTKSDDVTDIADEQMEKCCSIWPNPSMDAIYKVPIVGKFIDIVTENSEVDPMSFLLTFLSGFGAMVGSNPHIKVANTKHPARISSVLVGGSSRSRKGTSMNTVREILKMIEDSIDIDPLTITSGPLSSGEGLIDAMRDPRPNERPPDPGVIDKRLWCIEEEFANVLRMGGRLGNTLSVILRNAWDGGTLSPLTRSNKVCATNPHICILGHITLQELEKLLNNVDIFNGFANRFLWLCVQRKAVIAFPSILNQKEMCDLAIELGKLLLQARKLGHVGFSKSAEEFWLEKYPLISTDLPGRLGPLTARSEAHIMRLALVYALLDGKSQIDVNHLQAAMAIMQYSIDSLKLIFGSIKEDFNTMKVIETLSTGSKTTTELHAAFNGHLRGDVLKEILMQLQSSGKIKGNQSGGGAGKGQPVTIWGLIV